MAGLFSRLLGGKAETAVPLASAVDQRQRTRGDGSWRREPPDELDWSDAKYVPLPPSPRTWDVDGRVEWNREYSDPTLGPVLHAALRRQYAKTVKLAVDLSEEQLQGRVGEAVAKAYRQIVLQRSKAGQLNAAAKQSLKMFDTVPDFVQDSDRRRFNRIVADMDKASMKHNFEPVAVKPSAKPPLFSLSADAPWTLDGERKLDKGERPDPAFEVAAVDHAGTWLLLRATVTMAKPDATAALRRMDRSGHLIAKRRLDHDVYRVGKGSAGSSLAIMDSNGVLHLYDADARLLMETDLARDPRVVDHFRTIETDYWGEFKSQVRAVDVAPGDEKYLFTLADEAWCCRRDGHALWGVMMPLNEGWESVVGRSERFGVGIEVEDALRLFDLSLPVSPDDIRQKWKALALARHPDLNPDDPDATEKMKQVNAAFEILTGVDSDTLSFDSSDVTHFERSAPDHVIDVGGGMRLEITMSMGVPQDWVYTASFAANDGGAYVATYSGKVILLSGQGEAQIVYDLGICPDEILDIGRYTYFLTATRLYVVEDRVRLAAFLDVYQQGRLVVSTDGFGLLTDKALQWFTLDGKNLGSITTRDPIRAIYATDAGATIQTRRHQVEVSGLTI